MFTFHRILLSIALSLIGAAAVFAQGPELIVQTGHTSSIHTVAVTPDGRILASGSYDGTIKLWDAANGTVLRTLAANFAVSWWTHPLALSRDGRTLANGAGDSTIKLWDVESGALTRTLKAPVIDGNPECELGAMALSPDGRTLAFPCSIEIVLLDVESGQPLHILRGHKERIPAVVFSPDGNLLASGAWDRTVKIWNVKTGRLLRTIPASATALIISVAFSPDGRSVAVASHDGSIKLWNATTGLRLRLLKPADPANVKVTKTGLPDAVAFTADGRFVAAGFSGGEVRVWETATGALRRTFKSENVGVGSLVFAPDGQTLFGGGDGGSIYAWDVERSALRFPPVSIVQKVSAFTVSPDGRLLASGHVEQPKNSKEAENRIRVWSITNGKELSVLPDSPGEIGTMAFSPDGRTLASGASDCKNGDSAVELWDVAQNSVMRTLKGHRCEVLRVVFSPDGRTLLTIGNDVGFEDSPAYSVRLWDVASGRELRKFEPPKDPPYNLDSIHLNWQSLAISPDRQMIVSEGRIVNSQKQDGGDGEEQHSLKIWDFTKDQAPRLFDVSKEAYEAITFSPDGRTIAIGTATKTDGFGVKLIDTATGNAIQTFSGFRSRFHALAFSADGQTLAGSTFGDGAVKAVLTWFDLKAGKQLHALEEDCYDLAILPDGKTLVSRNGDDNSIVLRDLSSGEKIVSLFAVNDKDWLVVTPDGLFDGPPAAWSKLVWRFSPSLFDTQPVETFFNEFYYPGLLSDILNGKRPRATTDISAKDRRPPRVLIKQLQTPPPNDTSQPAARTVTLQLSVAEAISDGRHAAGGGARDVRLFRNGSLVRVWHGDVLKGSSNATLEATIPIMAGENNLTAYAFNRDNVKSADAALLIEGDERLRRKGTAYIVSVGVNQYATNSYFRNLKYAVADADGFAAEVKTQQQRLAHYEKVEVLKLTDAAATKANILDTLSQLAAKAQPEDAVIVYFAGHGLAQNNQFYLIPHDLGAGATSAPAGGQEALDVMLAARGISDQELERAFENVDAGQITMIIDACNSGQALGGERDGRGPMNAKGLAQLAYDKGMYILTAAQSFQAAQEVKLVGHGLLTYVLVNEGLKGASADGEPRDGSVLMREWLDYAADRVPQVQLEKMKEAGARGIDLSFSEGERGLNVERRNGQRPRVFYRREREARPLVVAQPGTAPVNN